MSMKIKLIHKKWFFIYLAFFALVLTYCFVRHKQKDYNLIVQKVTHRHGDVYIKGFHFTQAGPKKKRYSITADSFSICHGKLGFFSLGLFKIVKMENVKVDIHKDENKKEDHFDLANLLPKIHGKSFVKSKNIKGIYIKDITIRIYDDNELLSCISSKEVRIDPITKGIIFKGNAKIISQGRVLEAEGFVWLPKRHMFKTDGPCKFISEKGTIKGRKLEFDLLLKRIRLKKGGAYG